MYRGLSPIISQMICHSLSADSWIMSSWGCPSCHCHQMKLIEQLRTTVLSILTSCHYTVTSWRCMVWQCPNMPETFPKTFNHPCLQDSHRNSQTQFHDFSMIFHDQQCNFHDYFMHGLQPPLLAASSPHWAQMWNSATIMYLNKHACRPCILFEITKTWNPQ